MDSYYCGNDKNDKPISLSDKYYYDTNSDFEELSTPRNRNVSCY